MHKTNVTSSGNTTEQVRRSRLERFLPWILIICGVIGIIASVAITIEKIDLLEHPNSHFICDLNPIISCGSVMQSKQSHVFGFSNTFIGIVGFPILTTIGVAMLAGARFKRWFWLGMQAGMTLGIIFAYWLLYESIYRIGALCPFCLSVDVALTISLWYVTLYNFGRGYVTLHVNLRRIGSFARRHHLDILIFWFILMIALVLKHFWYYFGPHLFHLK